MASNQKATNTSSRQTIVPRTHPTYKRIKAGQTNLSYGGAPLYAFTQKDEKLYFEETPQGMVLVNITKISDEIKDSSPPNQSRIVYAIKKRSLLSRLAFWKS